VALARIAGLELDDWQQWLLDESLAEASTRPPRWSAFEVAVLVGRQNGKGSVLEARQLAGLFLVRERLQVHTAHEFKTCFEHFLRIVGLIESTPDLDSQVMRVRRGAGEQAVELRSGERLRFLARSGGSGRGMAGDCVYLDEAFALTAAMMGALLPTLSARPNPQVWYTSSAPMATSTVLHDVRKRGLAGVSPRLFMAEWGGAIDVDVEDRDVWYASNPALGIRITEEAVEAELDALRSTPEEFARERLGVPQEPLTHSSRLMVSAHQWVPLADPRSEIVGAPVLGVDVAPEGSSSAIGVAGVRRDGVGHVEVIDVRPGTAWVADRLAGIVERQLPVAVGVDASGPVQMLVPELRRVCASAGVKLVEVTSRAYAAACADFVQAVQDRRLAHLGQAWLDDTVAAGRRRDYGDGWMWDRRVGVDISPLVAVTVARRVAASEPVESVPLMAWR
jgi:uncharacterized protein YneR